MSDEKLLYDLFADGCWIGMAEGVDEDHAKRMAARSLPTLQGRFTLIRWYGRRHPDNCRTSGGNRADPLPEASIEPTEAAVSRAAEVLAETPMIDAPKLPAECWRGLARSVLEAAARCENQESPGGGAT